MVGKEKAGYPEGGEVEVEKIMAEVRRRAKGRSEYSDPESAHVSGFEAPQPSGSPNDLDPDLYSSLHQANVLCGRNEPDYEVGWRTPIVGHIWAAVRRLIHQEIRIYIDAQSSRIYSFNSHITRVLNKLIGELAALRLKTTLAELQSQGQELEMLRSELKDLKERMRRLEQARTGQGEGDGS